MYKLIAFDFDGTLADSVEFCLAVYKQVFEKFMGENAPSREEVFQNFGMNEPGIIKLFMGKPCPEAEQYFYKLHREQHGEWCPEPFEGAVELLEFLKAKQLTLTIITGRAEATCQISMDFLNLGKFFSHFQTGSPERNDKTAQLLALLERYNLKKDEIAYVGDAVSDAEACIRAGVDCLSAAWAKTAHIEELEKLNPGKVFRTVKSMQEYIASRIG